MVLYEPKAKLTIYFAPNWHEENSKTNSDEAARKSATSFCRRENFVKPIDKLSLVCYNYHTVQLYPV